MTFAELSDECWADLPPIRKFVAGRATADKVLSDAVLEFDPDRVGSADYEADLLERVKRRNRVTNGEGFAILTFLLVTIAAAVISWLIQRWLDNRFPKEQLDAWKREMWA